MKKAVARIKHLHWYKDDAWRFHRLLLEPYIGFYPVRLRGWYIKWCIPNIQISKAHSNIPDSHIGWPPLFVLPSTYLGAPPQKRLWHRSTSEALASPPKSGSALFDLIPSTASIKSHRSFSGSLSLQPIKSLASLLWFRLLPGPEEALPWSLKNKLPYPLMIIATAATG